MVSEAPVPIVYDGMVFDCAYRLDLMVEDTVIVELKAVTEVSGLHKAQLLSYPRDLLATRNIHTTHTSPCMTWDLSLRLEERYQYRILVIVERLLVLREVSRDLQLLVSVILTRNLS